MPKIIDLSGIVGRDITARDLSRELPEDNGPVLLKVDSVGGSVFEANRLFNVISDYPGEIKVELGAIAASAASYFPLAAGAENIAVRENTTFMAHKAWSFAVGNADEMKAEAEILDGLDRIIAKVYSKITGKSVNDTLAEMADEIWLIGGQEVVDSGFASEVIADDSDDSDEEKNQIIGRSEILAKIQEARSRLKESDTHEDMQKWAARIRNVLDQPIVNNEGQTLLFEEENNSLGVDMNWKEFLESNPEAKAEYDEAITAARAEGNEEAVKNDRERFAEVLALSGVAIPENVLNDARSGKTVAEFGVEELKRRNEAIAAAEPQEMGGIKPVAQVPEKGEGEEKSKAETVVDSAIDKIIGKDKEAK